MKSDPLSPQLARALNFAGLVGMLAVLTGAYTYQFYYRELPCTLCQMQRLAMLVVAFGAAMNVMRGPDPRHYGLCIVGAVAGLLVSLRQTALHINPYFDTAALKPTLSAASNPPFGQAVMGLHLYVWGIVVFVAVILLVGIVLLFRRQFSAARAAPAWLIRLSAIAGGLLLLFAATETVTTFLECGLGWNWWILRKS